MVCCLFDYFRQLRQLAILQDHLDGTLHLQILPFMNHVGTVKLIQLLVLVQFVGSMNQGMVRRFLRFVTGSSVCLTNQINVQFNSMSGIARRPISHTCDSMLELSSTYTSYPSFIEEFEAILSQPEVNWTMDAVQHQRVSLNLTILTTIYLTSSYRCPQYGY